jgi:DNA invertase Pin-like site-specific DNA recombinase
MDVWERGRTTGRKLDFMERTLRVKVIGYLRTSTNRQDLSLEVQEKRLRQEAEYRGFDIVIMQDQMSGSVAPRRRPGLSAALEQLANGDADALIVSKLDRVARSLNDIAHLLEQAKKQGWAFIALDLGVDTSTPEGALVLGIMASIAQWERSRIQERIVEALAQAKANGKTLGRPRLHPKAVNDRARELKGFGLSLHDISLRLKSEGITNGNGERLSPSAVHRLVKTG